MTREEAIKYLKSGCLGLNCSYHIKDRCNDDYEVREARKDEAIKMAIEDMEKQIPKKPNIEGDGYADGQLVYDTWICPNCETYYEIDYDDYDYCPKCGQKIDKSVFDWSEEDE